jgi:hypothetical protein
MENYFYINQIRQSSHETRISSVSGYFTDANHLLIALPQEKSRQEAIAMIKNGNVLFTHDGCYRRLRVKIMVIDKQEYLRVGRYAVPRDDLG